MAQSAAPPPVNSPAFLNWLREMFNRTQKLDEEYEPQGSATVGGATRVILRDSNGVRYAVTVSTAGALVVTAL